MMITTKFDIGDTVRVGPNTGRPNTGRITRILIGSTITYTITKWVNECPQEYQAYDWEITLVKPVNHGDSTGPDNHGDSL